MLALPAAAIAQQGGQTASGAITDRQRTDYEDAAGMLLSVPPELIDDFNRRILEVRAAAAGGRPQPVRTHSEADLVSLEPGAPSPTVRLAPGIATVITFTDATGRPWPVTGYVVGDGAGFEVLHPGDPAGDGPGPSHLTASPLREAGWSNLVVSLAEHPTPVVLAMEVDRREPHHRLDVQVMALGPLALPAAVEVPQAPTPGSRELLRFVAAADIPASAVEAAVDAVGGTRVWVSAPGGEGARRMWVRSPHALLGPQWSEVIAGPNGIRVYALSEAVHVLLFAVDGRTVLARVDLP